jgi:hypothetical protein
MAMEKHLFNLKFAAKQLERDSKKCDKEEKVEKNKLKKAIEKGNMEVARIHAENGEPCNCPHCQFLSLGLDLFLILLFH